MRRKYAWTILVILSLGAVTMIDASASTYHAAWRTQGAAVWAVAYETGQKEIDIRTVLGPQSLGTDGSTLHQYAVPYGDGLALLMGSHLYFFASDGTLDGAPVAVTERGIDLGKDSNDHLYTLGLLDAGARVTQLDTERQIVADHRFSVAESLGAKQASMAVTPEGSAYTVMTSGPPEISPCVYDYLNELMVVGSDGNITRTTLATLTGEVLREVAVAADGTAYIAGDQCYLYEDNPWTPVIGDTWTIHSPFMLHVSESGEILDRRVFAEWSWEHMLAFTLKIDDDGSIWMTGNDHPFAGQGAIGAYDTLGCGLVSHPTCAERQFVARFTSEMEPLWRTHFVIGQETTGVQFVFHPSGGVVVAGTAVHDTRPHADTNAVYEHQGFTAHVTPDGEIAWARVFDDVGGSIAEAATDPWCSGRTLNSNAVVIGSDVWTTGRACVPHPGQELEPKGRFDLFLTRAPLESAHADLTGPLATAVSHAHRIAVEGGAL